MLAVLLSFQLLFAFHNGPSHTLRLQNNSGKAVRVEVRTGQSTTCDSLGSLGVQALQPGQEWEVQFDDPVICWRLDQAPDAVASSWRAWNPLQLADGEVRAVIL